MHACAEKRSSGKALIIPARAQSLPPLVEVRGTAGAHKFEKFSRQISQQ
jgi:hypothetical protein